MYKHPGVYIEHVPSGLLAIEAASTSVAAFVGPVARGPVGAPTFLTGVSAFALQFGALNDAAGGIRDEGNAVDKFGHAVNAFFGNGGNKAYVVRVAEATGAGAPATAAAVIPNPDDAARGFSLGAANPGAWGNDLVVRLTPMDSGATPDLTLGYSLAVGSIVDGSFSAIELFGDLSTDANSSRFIETVVNTNSTLVTIAGGTLAAPDNIGAVTSQGIRGNPVTIGASGKVEVGGRGVDISIGGANTVTVVFDATANRRAYREFARQLIPRLLEVAIDCPLSVCMERDKKGIYHKGVRGESSTVPGLQEPYETPLTPDLIVDSTKTTPEAAADRILAVVRQRMAGFAS